MILLHIMWIILLQGWRWISRGGRWTTRSDVVSASIGGHRRPNGLSPQCPLPQDSGGRQGLLLRLQTVGLQHVADDRNHLHGREHRHDHFELWPYQGVQGLRHVRLHLRHIVRGGIGGAKNRSIPPNPGSLHHDVLLAALRLPLVFGLQVQHVGGAGSQRQRSSSGHVPSIFNFVIFFYLNNFKTQFLIEKTLVVIVQSRDQATPNAISVSNVS
jgi:hypothetical protein